MVTGFHLRRERSEILIWDWRSGVLLNRIRVEGTCSFGLLTPDCLSVFNCTNYQDTKHSIGLFIYNIREQLASPPASLNNTCEVADFTPLSPSVELCFPSRSVRLEYIRQHSTRSQRNPSSSTSSIFRISQDDSILHLTLCFRRGHDLRNPPPEDIYEIFISKSKLLKYTKDLSPSAGGSRRIGWAEWMESCTRWFHSEPLADSQANRWTMEGTRAIGTSYLKQENDYRHAFDYMTLVDFHPPTVQRFSGSCDKYQSTSLWKGNEARHVDLGSPRADLVSLYDIIQDYKHGDKPIVDVIGEDAPTFTKGFEEGTIVSRLPYRMVTRRMFCDRWMRWSLDEDRILDIPVSSCSCSEWSRA